MTTEPLPLAAPTDVGPPVSLRPAVAAAEPWHRLSLAAVLALSAFANFFWLNRAGYANVYYAAAIRSMLQNWHAFWYASFDSAGFVTIDKPPLGLWVQTASAWLFGFHGWSILLPQALAGVLSVAVLYRLVARTFGPTAGLLAALFLALTPISIITNRNNTMDSQLVLVVLLAAWAMLRATETGRWPWLLASVVLVGLGFNIKMLQAYLVLPALYAVYFLAAPHGWLQRSLRLAVATVVLAAVSFAWPLAVDLTPAEQRPYVGSSQRNSEFDLIFGYNGLFRLLGGAFGPQPGPAAQPSQPAAPQPAAKCGSLGGQTMPLGAAQPGGTNQLGTPGTVPAPGNVAPQPNTPGGPIVFSLGCENGDPGPLRLVNAQLGGQTSWLLPLALVGLVAAGWHRRPRFPLDRRYQSLVVWGLWFLTQAIFFSVANFYHRYYLVMLAPAVAALAGIGLAELWAAYRDNTRRGSLLPVALLLTAGLQVWLLQPFPGWSSSLVSLILVLAAVGVLGLVLARLPFGGRLRPALPLAAGIVSLLVAPAAWAAIPITTGLGSPLPSAGPMGGPNGPLPQLPPPAANGATNPPVSIPVGGAQQLPPPGNMPIGGAPLGGILGGPAGVADPKLVAYLQQHRGEARFLAASESTMEAAPLILATGEPVMALGGFSGGDPILTDQQLEAVIRAGEVRFFLLLGGPERPAAAGQTLIGGPPSSHGRWIRDHCREVPAAEWQTPGSQRDQLAPILLGGGPPMQTHEQLFDCGAR